MPTDRDPTNPADVAAAVRALILADLALSATDCEDRATDLLRVLLDQGVLTPEEHESAFVEAVEYEADCPDDSLVIVSWDDAPIVLCLGTDGSLVSTRGDI